MISMNQEMGIILLSTVIVFTALITQSEATKSSLPCSGGEWFNRKTALCVPCSGCPINQLIRKPCTPTKDTQCGPFYEFSTYLKGSGPQANKAPKYMDSQKDGVEDGDDGQEIEENKGDQKKIDNVVMTVSRYNDDVNSIQSDGEYWKDLCFALIGVLSFLLLNMFLYMLITHLRHRQSMCKNNAEQVVLDEESAHQLHTVVYHPRSSGDVHVSLPHLHAEQVRQASERSFLQRLFSNRRSNDYIHRIAVRDSLPEEEGLPLRVVIPAPGGAVRLMDQPLDGNVTSTSRDSGISVTMPPTAHL